MLGTIDIGEFSGDAAAAARWTHGVLGDAQRAWLAGLAPSAKRDGVELFHGSPRDPVWDYVLSEEVALMSLLETTAPLVLVGHSHVALGARLGRRELIGGLAPTEPGLNSQRRSGRTASVSAGARPPLSSLPSQPSAERDVAVADEHERSGRRKQARLGDLLAQDVVPDRIAGAPVEELAPRRASRRVRVPRASCAAAPRARSRVQRAARPASPLNSVMSIVPSTARSWLPQSANDERWRTRSTALVRRGPYPTVSPRHQSSSGDSAVDLREHRLECVKIGVDVREDCDRARG